MYCGGVFLTGLVLRSSYSCLWLTLRQSFAVFGLLLFIFSSDHLGTADESSGVEAEICGHRMLAQ